MKLPTPAAISSWRDGDRGDGARIHLHRVAESTVMGRLPVLVLATLVGCAGVAQLAGTYASTVVSDLGGRALDMTWASAMILAAVFALVSRLRGRRPESAILEIATILLLDVVLGTYVWALAHSDQGFNGALFAVALCTASMLNCTGRGWLLFQQIRLITKAAR